MRNYLSAIFLITLYALPVLAQDLRDESRSAGNWRPVQAENLLRWIVRADEEAIEIPHRTATDLRAAIDAGEPGRLNQVAGAAALQLLRAYHGQCCGSRMPANWHISQTVSDEELRGRIADGLAADQIDRVFRANRPRHPHYLALVEAYDRETDAARRRVLALNLARWRTLPLPREGRYLIVNAAAQELTLWEGATLGDRWRVIVGATSSPTPVFSVDVTGVVLNPWWNIPDSIAAEGIASLVRRNPSAARARGYIYSDGGYRQMPGDNNALGRMKLVMPNRFTVFLHDTSNRALFDLDQRALSHGCVRVDRALQFAATLLSADGWGQSQIDATVAAGDTVTIPLSRTIPLYIAYFTAAPDRAGTVRFLPDIYNRDGGAALRQAGLETECAAG